MTPPPNHSHLNQTKFISTKSTFNEDSYNQAWKIDEIKKDTTIKNLKYKVKTSYALNGSRSDVINIIKLFYKYYSEVIEKSFTNNPIDSKKIISSYSELTDRVIESIIYTC